jgi:uncharacterized protein (TIGR02118 family)
MTKLTILYGYPEDPEAFEKYYHEVHLPLAGQMKGIERLELTRFRPGPDDLRPAYYRMAELYFSDDDQLRATVDSPEGRKAIEDFPNFATGGVTLLAGSVEG